MRKKANSVDKNSPEYWAKMITGGRASLLLIVVLTVVNIVLLLIEADRYFVFSASIPYYLTASIGWLLSLRKLKSHAGIKSSFRCSQ